MLLTPDVSDKDLIATEVLATRENIASSREADTERIENSIAQTKKSIRTEINVPIGETAS